MLSADIISPGFIAVVVILIVILLILSSCIKIVPQASAMVVERLGGYLATWSVGVHFKIPFIDRVARKVILKEQVVDFAPQPVITQKIMLLCGSTQWYFSRLRIPSCMRTGWKIRSWPSKI